VRSEKGEGRREKGEGRREKGEGRREKGKGESGSRFPGASETGGFTGAGPSNSEL
jgi:hypothetical protein